jgi:methionyl-tRNA synthetase
LRYASLWWEDGPLLRRTEAGRPGEDVPHRRRVLITATPPTVNGPLHLGHISGPYLAADICRRYLALRGNDVRFVTGSDENQSYVVTKARERRWTPAATARVFGDQVERGLALLGIQPQVFARPSTSPHHVRFCQEFFARLHATGKLERRTSPALYCETCHRYLFEAHVSGDCPHCGHSSDGLACEDCARPNDCVDLVDPRCKQCHGTPGTRDVERLYFPLGAYESRLRAYLGSVTMPPHMRALCETMLAAGLPDIAVTHVADWGIPVPVAGFPDQVIYVWFEMCPGYLAATQQASETDDQLAGWEDVWKDPDAEIVQFFGFDNGYFHALLFPALLMAYDPSIRLPRTFVTNEFYLLDGEKFSSSREHAIWATDFAESQPADWVRFYLSLDRPQGRRTNFTMAAYQGTVQAQLSGLWMGWLADLARRVSDEFDGRAPVTATYTVEHRRFYRRLTKLIEQMEEALDWRTFSPPDATRVLGELVAAASSFGVSEASLAGIDSRRSDRRTAIALELAAARLLATLAAPVVPGLAGQLWRALGFPDEGSRQWEAVPAFVPGGQDVRGLGQLDPW